MRSSKVTIRSSTRHVVLKQHRLSCTGKATKRPALPLGFYTAGRIATPLIAHRFVVGSRRFHFYPPSPLLPPFQTRFLPLWCSTDVDAYAADRRCRPARRTGGKGWQRRLLPSLLLLQVARDDGFIICKSHWCDSGKWVYCRVGECGANVTVQVIG